MARLDQEIGHLRSYYTYMSDLHWSARSPYSVAINPATHLFANAASGLMGSTPSIHTRFVECEADQGIMVNALGVAFAYRFGTDFRKMVAPGAAEAERLRQLIFPQHRAEPPIEGIIEEEEDTQNPTVRPSAAIPDKRLDYMFTRDWKPGEELIKWGKSKVGTFRDLRPGSIGQHLYNFIIAL